MALWSGTSDQSKIFQIQCSRFHSQTVGQRCHLSSPFLQRIQTTLLGVFEELEKSESFISEVCEVLPQILLSHYHRYGFWICVIRSEFFLDTPYGHEEGGYAYELT